MPERRLSDRWWPSSKVTAMAVAGGVYVYGVWRLETAYGLNIRGWVAAVNMLWVLALVGYAVTENRGDRWP